MPLLEVAHNLSEIDEAFDLLIAHECPGFQVAPEVDLIEAKNHIESRMDPHIEGFIFNGRIHQTLARRGGPMHLDYDIAPFQRGLALHHTTEGMGAVALRFAGLRGYSSPPLGYTLDRRGLIGKKYVGKVMVGMKTVFSEGINSSLLERDVLPAAHKFKTDRRQKVRSFTRYTYNGYNPDYSSDTADSVPENYL